MSRFADLPIQRKLTLSIVLTCAAALLLACGAFVAYDVSSFRQEMVENNGSLARVVGNNTAAALEFNDAKSAADNLASFSAEPNIAAAFVYDRADALFAAYYRPGISPLAPAPPGREPAHEFREGQLRLSGPITNQGEQIGTILLISDLSELSQHMARYALIVTLVFAVALLLAFLLSRYFQRLIIRPILNLAALTRSVALENNYAGRAFKESNDEVGQLIEGFNHMLAQIETRDSQLQQAHALLEKRVEERTAALRQAQDEATREHARFKLIFDTMPVGICLIVHRPGAPQLRLLNQAHLRICGLTREQGDEPGIFQRLSHPDEYERQASLYRQLTAGVIRQFTLEKRYLRPDGQTVWVVYSLQRRDHPDSTRELLSTVVDITERKQAELEREQTGAALRASEDKFSKAFRTHPDSISICRLRDQVLFEINPGFTVLTGYPPAEALGRSSRPEGLDLWARVQDCERLLQTVRQAGSAPELETEIRRRDGVVLTCAVSASLMEVAGEPCVLMIARDVTAHKRLQAQLAQTGKMEAIGQLAGGVAHDYNNILTATLLQLEMLLTEEQITPTLRTALQELKKMAHRSADLTRQLLTFSRQQVIQMRKVDLNDVVVQLLRMLSRLLGENIQVSFEATAELLSLEADTGMLEQVVTNLCVNARDAMQPHGGRLTLSTSRVILTAEDTAKNPEARPGRFVCLAVEDTGCGMDATTLRHIFEPFFTTKDIGKGTGLGLATVYGIVQQHRGWVEVQSEVGRGSTFRVLLPYVAQPPPTATAPRPSTSVRGNETILIVEDEEMVRVMVVRALRNQGYRVLEAVDGTQALEVWNAHATEISLVISDMVMPKGLTGLDLAKRFRRERPSIKLIISSGYSVDLKNSAGTSGSGITYLAKPFDVMHLCALVRESLDGVTTTTN